jgi:hypothetical protein
MNAVRGILLRHPVRFTLAACVPWAASLACVTYRPVVTRPPTLGEELIQLDAARRDGLLTQEEHDRRRAEIIAAWKAIGDAPIEPVPPPAGPAPR